MAIMWQGKCKHCPHFWGCHGTCDHTLRKIEAMDKPSELQAALEDARQFVDAPEEGVPAYIGLTRQLCRALLSEHAEKERLREALREHAITSLFRPHDGPDNEVSGHMCKRCDCWWKLGTPEHHAPGCLAAPVEGP